MGKNSTGPELFLSATGVMTIQGAAEGWRGNTEQCGVSGIRHDKVNHYHPTFDFFYRLFALKTARDNGITLLLTVMPVLGYMFCWQQLKSWRYLPWGTWSHCSWFVYYSQLWCFGLLASWLVWKGDSWKSSVRLAQALGGPYHVPDCALDTDMLGDLAPDTCCLCLHFPPVKLLVVVLTLWNACSCTVAKLSMRQQMTSISCFVQAQQWERKRLFQLLWHWVHYISPSILNI